MRSLELGFDDVRLVVSLDEDGLLCLRITEEEGAAEVYLTPEESLDVAAAMLALARRGLEE